MPGIEVQPDDIQRVTRKAFRLSRKASGRMTAGMSTDPMSSRCGGGPVKQERKPGPGNPALFAVTASWCGFCKDFERNVAKALASGKRPFDYFYMDGDSIPARWKMDDMGLKTFPAVFVVLKDGVLCPYPLKNRRAEQLLEAVRRASL